METKTFILLQFENRAGLSDVLSKIEDLDGIKKIDAVDGHYSLVLRAVNGYETSVDDLKALDGLRAIHKCDVKTEESAPSDPDPEFPSSYVFIEADKEIIESLVGTLKRFEGITRLIRTDGDYDIVALLQGKDFDTIDRRITGEVSTLDGVLRLRSNRVIDLDTM